MTRRVKKFAEQYLLYGSKGFALVNPYSDKERMKVQPRELSYERQEMQLKKVAKEEWRKIGGFEKMDGESSLISASLSEKSLHRTR